MLSFFEVSMKKYTLAGGEVPAISLQGIGPVHEMVEKKEGKLNVWKEGDPDPGFVLGSAIRFIPLWIYDLENDKHIDSDGVERIACMGPFPHDYIYNDLRWNMDHPYSVSGNDDQQTHYGFVTSNGFFVDRHKAGYIWQQMLKTAGWRDPSFEKEFAPNLYSYCYKPEVIDHHVSAALKLSLKPN